MIAILSFVVICDLALVAATAWAPVSADRRRALRSALSWSALWALGMGLAYIFAFLSLTVAGGEQAAKFALMCLMAAIATPVAAGAAAIGYGAAALAMPAMYRLAADRASLAIYVTVGVFAVILMGTNGSVSPSDWPGYFLALLVVPAIAFSIAKMPKLPVVMPKRSSDQARSQSPRRADTNASRQPVLRQVRPAVRPDRIEARRIEPILDRQPQRRAFPAKRPGAADILRQLERLSSDLRSSMAPGFPGPSVSTAHAQRHTDSRPSAPVALRARPVRQEPVRESPPREWPTLIGAPIDDTDPV